MHKLLTYLRRRAREERLYRIYVTDALYALCQFAGIGLKGRYADAIRPSAPDGRALARERLESMGIEVIE